ncbi:MAG TPA: VWA domain-containing protein [Thermoanaerobaculia bacterium]|nr:VWA domain-containing protein [Thermoanaerobaculia bacterium]
MHRFRLLDPYLAWILVLWMVHPVSATAQQTLPGFAEVIEVRVVNVEVVVTDRDGRRVPGLAAADFELLVDGKPVPIEYFSEIRDGSLAPSASHASAEGEAAPVPTVGEQGRLRTHYLVFVDDFFSIAQDRDRVLDRLGESFAELRPDDRVAVVAFDGKELALLASWTADRAALGDALRRAKARPAFGNQRLTELRQNDSERGNRRDLELLQIERVRAVGGELPDRPTRLGLDPVERGFAMRLTQQVQNSVLAAASALRSFSAPGGRKVMLVLSGGWPYSPAEYTVNQFGANVEDVGDAIYDTKPLLDPLITTANLLGYTLYPVDVPGQDREIGTDATQGFTELVRLGESPSATAGGTATAREQHVHYALQSMAESTGGRALINAERDRALAEVIADTATFYWLGFTPDREENDATHRIEVRIKQPGLSVRAREGFVDLSRQAEVTMMVESALLFGDPPSARPLQLRFGRPQKAGLGRMRLPLEVGIPIGEITLVDTGGTWVNRLEVRTVVMDEVGSRSETTLDQVDIEGKRPPQPGDVFYYETDLRLRRKPHRLVVAVYDPLSGVILSSSAEIDP